MGNCDTCGKSAPLFRAEIEGTMMNVCRECGSFGKILGSAEKPIIAPKRTIVQEPESQEMLVNEYNKIIKQKREQLKMTQEDFSKLIREKLSILQKIESGNYHPGIQTARKLEKMLKIRLVEEVENVKIKKTGEKMQSMTIGDLLAKK